ncbi:MAG: redoxin domain-containing protein [Gammaproteobacteria bacterium]
MLTIGQTIPAIDVEALTPHGDYRIINLGEQRSRWKVLFFWQWDFTFTCLMNIRAYHDLVRQFTESDAILLGASVDSVYAHRAWTTNGLGKIGFPLIGDATRQLARRFGVLSGEEGMAEYATFIIDPSGQVAGVSTNPMNVSHSAREALHMLRMIQTGRAADHDQPPSPPYGRVA